MAPLPLRRSDGENDEPSANRVQLAPEQGLPEDTNRRTHQRLRDEELRWVRNTRIAKGHTVTLVDLSAGGALIDSPVMLRPSSLLALEITGAGFDTSVEFRVVRCQVGAVNAERTTYRAACEFTRLIALPELPPEGARVLYPGAFTGLDLALKRLAESVRPTGGFGSLDAGTVSRELETLRTRALQTPSDPMGNPLAALLAHVVPALERCEELPTILRRIQGELRRTVPQVSLRLTQVDGPAAPGVKSILLNVPGSSTESALVSIDLPRGVVLNAWQARMLRVTSRLIALVQRLEPKPADADPRVIGVPSAATLENPAPVVTAAPAPVEAPSPDPLQAAWQKIVVRYAEGQILKGYAQDFSTARSQFTLWPSLSAAASERVIVPLARLKAVFFVRDFAGNPGYVERTDAGQAQHGRRIEVTLADDEVIVGRTLSYRPDGHGFFVVPADPLANNVRIFVVSSSVRQVRFP